jgi:hypothetical protein
MFEERIKKPGISARYILPPCVKCNRSSTRSPTLNGGIVGFPTGLQTLRGWAYGLG